MALNKPDGIAKNKKEQLMQLSGLHAFFVDGKLNVAAAWNGGMIDELRGLCIKIVSDKTKYFDSYRELFGDELSALIELFGLYYIRSNEQTQQLEGLLDLIRKDIFAMGHKKSYIDKEYMIQHIGKFLDDNKDTLTRLNIPADGALIKSLYSSYVNNSKVGIDEKRKRYNRLLFAYQLEQPIAAHIRQRTARVDTVRSVVNEQISETIQTVGMQQKDLLTYTIDIGTLGSFDIHTDVVHNVQEQYFVFPHKQKILSYRFVQGVWQLSIHTLQADNKKGAEISVHTVQEKSDFYVFLRECIYKHLV